MKFSPPPFLTLITLVAISSCDQKDDASATITDPAVKEESNLREKDLEESPAGMVLIPGGTYTRGTTKGEGDAAMFPEEFPAHEVTVEAFHMDEHEVTNAEFLKFVEATGWITQAEKGWSAVDFPLAPPEALKPGALVFRSPPEKPSFTGRRRNPSSTWTSRSFSRAAPRKSTASSSASHRPPKSCS